VNSATSKIFDVSKLTVNFNFFDVLIFVTSENFDVAFLTKVLTHQKLFCFCFFVFFFFFFVVIK
jgi:hypothetical protein